MAVTASLLDDPEFALLVAATARPATASHRATIAGAVAPDAIDWPRFVKLVERHRVAPLAFDGLAAVRNDMPADTHNTLRGWAMRDRAKALQLVAMLGTVTARLAEAGIVSTTMKGPTLALLAFGDASLRQSKDLDILISPDQIGRALAVMQAAGFALTLPGGNPPSERLRTWTRIFKDISLFHAGTGTLIELHWRLSENPHLFPVPTTPAQIVTIGPVESRTFAADDLLRYLCVHGALHVWFRLKWLADVHALLAPDGGSAVSRFHAEAVARGLEVPAGLMLLLLRDIYGMALPDELAAMPERDRRMRWLLRLARRFIGEVREPGVGRLSAIPMVLAPILLRREPRYVLRAAVTPLVDWPTVNWLGGSRWAYVVAIIGRPMFWGVRKLRWGR